MLFFQQKKVSFVFISRSRSLSPFFSLSFAGLSPTFSFSLSFSCSIFQICGHDNESKLNTLDNTDTKTISAFRFRLYWLFGCLCFTRRRWLCDIPPKRPLVVFGLLYLLIELFYIGTPAVWTDGRSVGVRSRDYQIFSMGRLLHFLTHGAPRARERELHYNVTRTVYSKDSVNLKVGAFVYVKSRIKYSITVYLIGPYRICRAGMLWASTNGA